MSDLASADILKTTPPSDARGICARIVAPPSGFAPDALGVIVPVNRTFAGNAAAALINLVIPAQGVGIKIRVLEWQYQANALVAHFTGFFSGIVQISALLPFQGASTYQWQTYTEAGHFETLANQALNFNFTVAGAPWGLNLLWIATP